MTAEIRRLLGLPVRVGPLRVGIVEDVVVGADLDVVLGFVVATAARTCFLPWAAGTPGTDGIDAASAAAILGDVELAYYLARGVRVTSLPDPETPVSPDPGRAVRALVPEPAFP